MSDIAAVHASMDNMPAAKEMYGQALAMRQSVLPAGHVKIAATMNQLANVLVEMGEQEAALHMLEGAIRIYREALPHGDTTLTLAKSLNQLATVHVALGHHNAAVTVFEEVLHIQRGALEPEDPAPAATLLNLGMLYEQAARRMDAHTAYTEAVSIFRKVLPDDHPHVLFAKAGKERTLAAVDNEDGR
jgi:tetratricopeptide (TPR) repeat protein